jgi:hypothetical protein
MEIDRAQATTRFDLEAIAQTASPREALVHLDPSARDFLHAAAMLGRLLASLGASPTLAAVTMDGWGRATESRESTAAARAALLEAYVSEREAQTREIDTARWKYPNCAVRIDAETCAVAAGIPDDDDDHVLAWADSVARELARAKVRRAIVSGNERARQALEDALAVMGIRAEREFVVR